MEAIMEAEDEERAKVQFLGVSLGVILPWLLLGSGFFFWGLVLVGFLLVSILVFFPSWDPGDNWLSEWGAPFCRCALALIWCLMLWVPLIFIIYFQRLIKLFLPLKKKGDMPSNDFYLRWSNWWGIGWVWSQIQRFYTFSKVSVSLVWTIPRRSKILSCNICGPVWFSLVLTREFGGLVRTKQATCAPFFDVFEGFSCIPY